MLCGQPVFGLAACDQPPPVNMPKLDSMEGPCEASDVAKPEMAIPAGRRGREASGHIPGVFWGLQVAAAPTHTRI